MGSVQNKRTGCIAVFWVCVLVLTVIVVTKLWIDRQNQIVKKDRKALVAASLRSAWSVVETYEAANASRSTQLLQAVVIDHLKREAIEGFVVCATAQDDEPFVVYEGELTQPYVMVLFRGGHSTQWTMDEWIKNPHRKSAVSVHR